MEPKTNPNTDHAAGPCGLGRRLLVMLYDGLALIALLLLATAVALLAGSGQVTAGKDLLFSLYLLAVWFFYLAGFWRRGMTVGMRAWKVEITDDGGGAPGWGQFLGRFAVSIFSASCFGLGFCWSAFDARKRTWHDMASRTRLVRR